MIIHWLILLITLLFTLINANINKPIAVVEHKSNDNDSLDQSWKTTSEKILIRVTRTNSYIIRNDRQRREAVDIDDIWGMTKKVAITVFVLISLCMVCCIVTIIYICMKCCCGGNNNRKRNQGFNTIPQPIIIHTSSPNYQPQFHQQQAPSSQYHQQQIPSAQIWQPENHPMLPQPSAPPQPDDDFRMDRPPPYEKICAT